MKTSIVLIILCLCSSLSATRGKCSMNMPNDNQCMSMTSQESMNNTYLLIQQGEYDNAYDTFIAGVDRNDETLGGFIFETIINGLRIFGYIKNFEIKDYGIPSASIDVIKNIDKADVISVFNAIYYIAHNSEQFANKSIAECFKSIAQMMSSDEDNISSMDKPQGELVKQTVGNTIVDDTSIDTITGIKNTSINTTAEINEPISQDDSNKVNENGSMLQYNSSAGIFQRDLTKKEETKPKKAIGIGMNSQNIGSKNKWTKGERKRYKV